MFILYFGFLPAFLIVVATGTVKIERARHELVPLDREPDPYLAASALGFFKFVRQGTVFFSAALLVLTAVVIWQAAQGDVAAIKTLPIAIILVAGTLWILFLAARLRCAAQGITKPSSYFRDQANESPYRD